ncbi:hypothetical protein B0T14DRAFT_492870 [Immersiella caudata]|uniref:Xylanolytic transcriptional activator regulatory domain-containing protein n=1 Tax=Immersiella caudata TaxID=314043 RepID=A0AA39X421_9PEZI|nr:hypothetical protein B0T14DRAFT_492870 [Immersiella caudata]
MVRSMMDGTEGHGVAALVRERQRLLQQHDTNENVASGKEETHDQVVFGRATAYVGATHFMAMLDDRYFGTSSPTAPLVHRPTFVKEYNIFWNEPYGVSLEWLALLLMILALGTFFSIHVAPHEVESPNGPSAIDVYRRYRAAAGWAFPAC